MASVDGALCEDFRTPEWFDIPSGGCFDEEEDGFPGC